MREEGAVLVHEPDPAPMRRRLPPDRGRRGGRGPRPAAARPATTRRSVLLPLPLGPEHGDPLALRHLEVDPGQRGRAVERHPHVLDPQH